jgi:hypothetical protein
MTKRREHPHRAGTPRRTPTAAGADRTATVGKTEATLTDAELDHVAGGAIGPCNMPVRPPRHS